MKRALVITNHHELLPVFNRLRNSGVETDLVVWNSKYEAAWRGLASQVVSRTDGSLTQANFHRFVADAAQGDLTVLTNVHGVIGWFDGAPVLGPGPKDDLVPQDHLLLGGWFDGEHAQAPHLLVTDHGAWPGGLGPQVPGGMTLVRLGGAEELPGADAASSLTPPFVQGALAQVEDLLKRESYVGLFHFDVEEDVATGEMQLRGLATGWPFLQLHAFLAEVGNFTEVLEGAVPRLGKRFVTVLPVSQPPWPNRRQGGRREATEVKGLTEAQQRQLFWHDVESQDGKLYTAGLDGLVAVAVGSADSGAALAQHRALGLAARMELPEKQFRTDAAERGIKTKPLFSHKLSDRQK